MQNQQNIDIFKQVDSLPALPATVSKVLSVTADPESSVEDLVYAILPDQAMCATILKIANSAFFGMPREVATMDKAVTILGFNEIFNIVLGKAVLNSFQKITKQNKEIIDRFWNHSFSCALAAKILAEDFKCASSELFIGGLIHDIGKLVFFTSRPEEYIHILELEGTDQIKCKEQEIDTFGIDHEEVGHHLLNRWFFPDTLLCGVGFHHQPEKCGINQRHALIVQISDALSLLATVQNKTQKKSLLPQLVSLLPESEKILQKHKLNIDEEKLQKWLDLLYESLEKDSGILHIFTS